MNIERKAVTVERIDGASSDARARLVGRGGLYPGEALAPLNIATFGLRVAVLSRRHPGQDHFAGLNSEALAGEAFPRFCSASQGRCGRSAAL